MPDFGLPTMQLRINPRTGQPELSPMPIETAPTIDPATGQPTQTGIGQLMVPQTQAPYQSQQAQQVQAIMNAGRPAPGMTPAPSVGAAAAPQSPPGAPKPSVSLANNLAGLAAPQSPQGNQQAVSQWDKALQTLTGPTKEALFLQMGLGLLGDRPAGTSSANAISRAGLGALEGHSARVREDRQAKRADRLEALEERKLSVAEAAAKDKIALQKEELAIKRANAKSLQEYRKGLAASGGVKGSKPAASVQLLDYVARAEKARANELGQKMTDAEAILTAQDKMSKAKSKTREEWIGERVMLAQELDEPTDKSAIDVFAAEWDLINGAEAQEPEPDLADLDLGAVKLPEGVTPQDVEFTARKHNMPYSQVIQRLGAQ